MHGQAMDWVLSIAICQHLSSWLPAQPIRSKCKLFQVAFGSRATSRANTPEFRFVPQATPFSISTTRPGFRRTSVVARSMASMPSTKWLSTVCTTPKPSPAFSSTRWPTACRPAFPSWSTSIPSPKAPSNSMDRRSKSLEHLPTPLSWPGLPQQLGHPRKCRRSPARPMP